MLTEKQLEEIQARCDEATEADWWTIQDDVAALIADNRAKQKEIERLEGLLHCDCGRELGSGLCPICDNDD